MTDTYLYTAKDISRQCFMIVISNKIWQPKNIKVDLSHFTNEDWEFVLGSLERHLARLGGNPDVKTYKRINGNFKKRRDYVYQNIVQCIHMIQSKRDNVYSTGLCIACGFVTDKNKIEYICGLPICFACEYRANFKELSLLSFHI